MSCKCGTCRTCNVRGLQGEVGPAGTDGTNGTNGADSIVAGPPGTNGDNGIAGTNGINGTNGTNGVNGADGVNGVDGADGISINWLGPFPSAPLSPNLNDAYYDETQGISYIWDGNSWEIVAQDGADGADGTNGLDGAAGPAGSVNGTSTVNVTNAGVWSIIITSTQLVAFSKSVLQMGSSQFIIMIGQSTIFPDYEDAVANGSCTGYRYNNGTGNVEGFFTTVGVFKTTII